MIQCSQLATGRGGGSSWGGVWSSAMTAACLPEVEDGAYSCATCSAVCPALLVSVASAALSSSVLTTSRCAKRAACVGEILDDT